MGVVVVSLRIAEQLIRNGATIQEATRRSGMRECDLFQFPAQKQVLDSGVSKTPIPEKVSPSRPSLSLNQRLVFKTLSGCKPMTVQVISYHSGMKERAASQALRDLFEIGLVSKYGINKWFVDGDKEI